MALENGDATKNKHYSIETKNTVFMLVMGLASTQ